MEKESRWIAKHGDLNRGFQPARTVLQNLPGNLIISKQKLRQAEAVACVRLKREQATQKLGFASRPFVLCGLPVKKPQIGQLLHERRNGSFLLQVTGHPSYGLPWGQDRLVPIFLATLAIRQQSRVIHFRSAAEMLDTFGMQQGGTQYRRLVAAFQRIFGATIFFGTDTQRERATVVHRARFNFMSEARIWYSRDFRTRDASVRFSERDRTQRRVLQGDPGTPDSDGHGSGESSVVFAGGARSVYMAFLPVLRSKGQRTCSALWRDRIGKPARECRVHQAEEVQGKTGRLAGLSSRVMA